MKPWRERDGEWTTQQAEWLGERPRDKTSGRLQSHLQYWDDTYCIEFLEGLSELIPSSGIELVVASDVGGVSQMICEALAGRYNHCYDDIGALVGEFSNLCAPRVVTAGRSAYEIVFTKPGENCESANKFHMMHVENYSKRISKHMQYQPGRGWRSLNGDLLVVFSLDKARRAAARRAMKALATASRRGPTHRRLLPRRPPGYDLKVHQEREAVAVYRATRSVGWNAFGGPPHLRETYQVSRYLTWFEFRLSLRRMTIDGLNRALQIAGAEIGFNARLEDRGRPTIEELTEARARLADGRCETLVELLDSLFGRA